jgi:hypothetical protein
MPHHLLQGRPRKKGPVLAAEKACLNRTEACLLNGRYAGDFDPFDLLEEWCSSSGEHQQNKDSGEIGDGCE